MLVKMRVRLPAVPVEPVVVPMMGVVNVRVGVGQGIVSVSMRMTLADV